MKSFIRVLVLSLTFGSLVACATSGKDKPPKCCSGPFVPINSLDHYPQPAAAKGNAK